MPRESDGQGARIVARNLSKVFRENGQETPAFLDLDFTINGGEFFCLLGPSGCGKSTALRTICGLEKPTNGQLTIGSGVGANVNFGMVFQEHGLFPWMSLAENIRFLVKNHPQIEKRDVEKITARYLDRVGLSKFGSYYPHQVSGGMRQRIAIARSFAYDADILLMDEPFVYLDYQTRLMLQDTLLSIWQSTKKTVVFVTHNIAEAVTLADRILIMTAHPGRIKKIFDIDFPRPRDVFEVRKTQQFSDRVNEITELLREEMFAEQDQALHEVLTSQGKPSR